MRPRVTGNAGSSLTKGNEMTRITPILLFVLTFAPGCGGKLAATGKLLSGARERIRSLDTNANRLAAQYILVLHESLKASKLKPHQKAEVMEKARALARSVTSDTGKAHRILEILFQIIQGLGT